MISLIINADDLGSNADRDRGILKAYEEGIVTSASLLANGPSFYTAIERVKQSKMPVGIHLNLADGTTLAGPIEGLTDTCGKLPGKQKLRQCLATGNCDHHAIRNELAAQIELPLNEGLKPDHLDSHQHCQLFPCISKMVTELAIEYGIKAMRTSLPAEPVSHDPPGTLGEEMALYRQLARKAHSTILNAGLKTTDGLLGMPLLNKLDEASLCRQLENIPDGRWELMTHPGYTSQTGNHFSGPQREVELQALLSTAAKQIIKQRNINLCTFGDLPCAP